MCRVQKPRGERGPSLLREEPMPCEAGRSERQAGEVSRGQPAGLRGHGEESGLCLEGSRQPWKALNREGTRTDLDRSLWLPCRG